MQPDCNLVLYQLNPKKPIMNSNTQGKGTNCVLKLDTDDNLVIRNEWLNIMWQSGTARTIGSYVLLLQRNGKVVIYGTPIWNSGTKFTAAAVLITLSHFVTGGAALNHLLSGDTLNTGQSISEGRRSLVMQPDCNLVLYQLNPKKPIWYTQTNGKGTNCVAKLETDGSLVVRDQRLNIVWTSGTGKRIGNYVLLLQWDGNMVIYGEPIWSRPGT
ncbi:Mannose-specific lectin 1 [Platanthera zijinensis]|uniref:Mannose-specific lectin 1 n=1 Tax=Platanthera zijinensis TaxID=2320716 RepID=A0AAP0FYF5_9ASPA